MITRCIISLLLITTCQTALAQVNLIPFAGMNSTRMYHSFGFEKGGSYGIAGLEIEVRKRPKAFKPLHVSFVTGVSYLHNGFYQSDNFSFTGADFYTASITDREMEYLQIPLMARLYWQPFPLVEDWKVFIGAGISYNLLLKAHLAETYTSIFTSGDIFAPPPTEQYEDSRDVTSLGKEAPIFRRIDIGMTYKRFQINVRFSKSITDLYYEGLENDWGVPAEYSEYLIAYADEGKITEKYSEITFGFRIFK